MEKLKKYFTIMILTSAFLISTKNIYSQWTIAGDLPGVSSRPTVSVVDGNTAFVTGGSDSNFTYKTTNGGTNWIQLNTNTIRPFWCIWAKDPNIVFAGAIGILGVPGIIKFYKTINGGIDWTVIDSNFAETVVFTNIKFSNSIPSFGIVVGGAPDGDFYTYKTRDGGNMWTRYLVTGFAGINAGVNSLNIIDSLFYAVGSRVISPSIIITTDGGVTWNLRDLNLPSSGFNFTNGIAFKEDKLTGIAASTLPIIARTTNGGLNWVNIDVGNNVTSTHVIMRWIEGTNICYIATESTSGEGVLKSTNGGLNWTPMSTSGVGIYNFDTKRIGSNVYGYANSSIGALVGGNQVLKVTDVITGINQISELAPDRYNLSQNYPNPFNPNTVIGYQLAVSGIASLKIYDALGREVATLVNEKQNAGSYNYQLSTDNYQLTSGVYFYKLAVDGNIIDTKRMMLLK